MPERILTPAAQADRDDFDEFHQERGCTCFDKPPCGFCIHPGNPLNQQGDDCWREVLTPTEALGRIHKLLDGQEWSSETLDDIAVVLADAGYTIEGPSDD